MNKRVRFDKLPFSKQVVYVIYKYSIPLLLVLSAIALVLVEPKVATDGGGKEEATDTKTEAVVVPNVRVVPVTVPIVVPYVEVAKLEAPTPVPESPYNTPYDTNGNLYPVIDWSLDLSEEDIYYLAKIVKCEAGVCDMRTKIVHALVVLNRVRSDAFPNSVYEVITQHYGKVYQFSPVIPGGTWYRVEPDEECYQAVEYALSMDYDISYGATYFEATGRDDVWHQRALKQVCESGGVRFYTVP